MKAELTRRGLTVRGTALCAPALVLGAAGAAQTQAAIHSRQPVSSIQKAQQAFPFLALRVFVEVDCAATNGAVAILRIFVPPGQGAAPHVHSREDEIHTVLRGHYRYRHGNEEVEAPAGTTLFMPRGIPHTFRNIGEEPGEHLLTLLPGGLEKWFREVSAAAIQLPRDRARYDEISARYGMRSVPPESLPLSTRP
jgi:quercetin dioxygenase-like cupin family protein